MAPNDYYLFMHLRTFLAGKRFEDIEELQEAIGTWLFLTGEFFAAGIAKLISCIDKCLNLNGNYVEK